MSDDVSFAGKPKSGGLSHVIPQSLLRYAECPLNEVEECDSHNRLLDLVLSNHYGSIPTLSVVSNRAGSAVSLLSLTYDK